MGCAFSSAGSAGALRPCSGVRVIHTNGYVEDFEGPGVVTVATVTGCLSSDPAADGNGDSKGYVLCSAAHLLQPGRGPFRPDDALQPGTVYFLLPQSVFQAESSAVDLACLMNRLTALARKGCATAAPKPSPLDALFDAAAAAGGGSRQHHPVAVAVPVPAASKEKDQAGRAAPWRPRLDRIDESIGRSSMRSASSRSEA
ncbi:hypothetical protein BDA96_10G324000 [Sorghum bicolor]|uniref:Uncharacterized protein n=1 Tax=Sorghum bicolor TaxID=4558 RepID=A0A921U2X5_SORBI|nr:hypothetical protein BDA96_10G324000 [Sorghum bicolor]